MCESGMCSVVFILFCCGDQSMVILYKFYKSLLPFYGVADALIRVFYEG